MATLIKIDKNGSKHYEGLIPCDRCGGTGGSDNWKYTGYTCYKCGGAGTVFSTWIERTPEYEAKLIAKRNAKIEAEAKAHEAEIAKAKAEAEAEAEKWRIIEAANAAFDIARKAVSNYVGNIGDKLNMTVVLDHTAWFDFRMGWKEERMFIHTFRDICGNTLVWKTSKSLMFDNGDTVVLTGTVKEFNEYKGEKQTVLTRCKVKRAGA